MIYPNYHPDLSQKLRDNNNNNTTMNLQKQKRWIFLNSSMTSM